MFGLQRMLSRVWVNLKAPSAVSSVKRVVDLVARQANQIAKL
jgi:hypothetical protein